MFVMSCHRTKHILVTVVFGVVAVRAAMPQAGGEKPLTDPATDEEIAALIRDLGDPSHETRTFATRRLCAVGMFAAEKIRDAAEGDEVETALRAKAVLAVLDRLLFAGVEVRLAFSKTRIGWDEPVDLTVTMTNSSNYPARVPFEIDPAGRRAVTHDARQVGDMLDVAEWVLVRHTDGQEIELTVDDIAADPAVVAAVQERLNGGPVGVLEPKQQVVMTARAFNRGWARYALLDAGVYTVVMEYVPRWQDEVLAAQRVGHVVSNEVKIAVTNSAPAPISRDGVEASLSVQRDGPFILALITNRTDQPVFVNKNFGRSPPFAEGRWIYELENTRRKVPIISKTGASWHDFDAALLVQVEPGQSLELVRTRVDELRRALADAGAALDSPRWTVHFRYMNLCDRSWQARQGSALISNPKAPAIFQSTLPRRILSTRYASNRLTTPGAD